MLPQHKKAYFHMHIFAFWVSTININVDNLLLYCLLLQKYILFCYIKEENLGDKERRN